jgi:hypothetical protein
MQQAIVLATFAFFSLVSVSCKRSVDSSNVNESVVQSDASKKDVDLSKYIAGPGECDG